MPLPYQNTIITIYGVSYLANITETQRCQPNNLPNWNISRILAHKAGQQFLLIQSIRFLLHACSKIYGANAYLFGFLSWDVIVLGIYNYFKNRKR